MVPELNFRQDAMSYNDFILFNSSEIVKSLFETK